MNTMIICIGKLEHFDAFLQAANFYLIDIQNLEGWGMSAGKLDFPFARNLNVC